MSQMPKIPNRNDKEFNAETRQIILQTSRRLFLEFGFRAVSTRRIAEACGLTQPALYHHFANKQDLYLAVHQEMLTETHNGLERVARRSGHLKDSISGVVRYLLATQSEDTNLLFHDLAHELDMDVRDNIGNLFRENVVAPIAAIFARAIDQHILLNIDEGGISPMAATYLLLSMVQGMAHVPSQPEPDMALYSVDKTADSIAEIIVNGLPRSRPS